MKSKTTLETSEFLASPSFNTKRPRSDEDDDFFNPRSFSKRPARSRVFHACNFVSQFNKVLEECEMENTLTELSLLKIEPTAVTAAEAQMSETVDENSSP